MLVKDKDIMKVNKELIRLRAENTEMKEKLQNYIPRRRVRRVFKQMKTILEADIQDDNKIYLDQLKEFIQKIEKEGPQMAGQEIKTAIEHIIGDYELKDPCDHEEIDVSSAKITLDISNAVESVLRTATDNLINGTQSNTQPKGMMCAAYNTEEK